MIQFFESRATPTREADDRREAEAERGDEARIEQADEKGAAIGRGGAVGDQALVDVEARDIAEKAEVGRDAARLHIGADIDEGRDDEGDKSGATNKRRLQHRGPANSRIIPEAKGPRFGGCGLLRPPSGCRQRPRSMRNAISRALSDRRRILQPAFGPKRIDAALDLQRASLRRDCDRTPRRNCRPA